MASCFTLLTFCLLIVASNWRVDSEVVKTSPPDHRKVVAMARYIIHNADWASVATLSTIPDVENFPFANVNSMSDGPVHNSTGVPYFYLTPLDFTAKDLKKNPRCTVLASLEETDFCQSHNLDPEDPRCSRIMLVGKMVKVNRNTTEYAFAEAALFSRHPSFPSLPKDHGFFVAKLKVAYISMLDWFGGPHIIPVNDYFAFNYTRIEKYKPKNTHQYNAIRL